MASILVAEDNLVMQKLLSKRLRDAGHHIQLAENGIEALALLERVPVDLILCDIAMPQMDGLTLLRRVRRNEQFHHVPIVMLTTSVLDQHRQEAQQAGANGFLLKPVSSWELETMINSLLTVEQS
jgi:chemotaxis family two-component system sensor histidine kinase/response regulator PixL